MTSSKWQVTPTTADIGFVAESSTIPELFIVSSVAIQCIRLGLEPDEDLPLATGEEITIAIDKIRENRQGSGSLVGGDKLGG